MPHKASRRQTLPAVSYTHLSVHEGTIIEMLDKGAVVALPYGVEGFATPVSYTHLDVYKRQPLIAYPLSLIPYPILLIFFSFSSSMILICFFFSFVQKAGAERVS